MKTRTSLRPLVTVLAIVSLGVAGCSGGTGYNSSVESMAASDGGMVSADYAAGSDIEMGAAEDMKPQVGSSIIVSGDATVITPDPRGKAAEFSEQVLALGGRIDSSSSSDFQNQPFASVSAAVPAERFDEVLSSLDSLGRVENSSVYNQDVTQQVTDLDARIAVLEDSLDRLKALMEQATTVEELIAAENGLTQRQAELDSLNAQLEWLSGQVEMSNLYVNFSTEVDSSGFSFEKAWQFILKSFEVIGYALLIALPWVILILLITAVVRVILARRRNQKHAGFTIDTDTTTPEKEGGDSQGE
ncbi:DUF4349 domain-containing protein [Actinomyces minihominis]|uniref:DUF4349 domain-containing protein n=1 Tax=Actinomyces minihominis TaxID=2002838 RepID=UPI00101AEB76|nr:DUF4349 domain-containing protein [Actinomyces minihominis]